MTKKQKKETASDIFALPRSGRTLFTSDWHIGADTWGRDRREELTRAVSALADEGKRAGVENVVVGGDIFDSFRYPGRDDLALASALFARLCAIPTLQRLIVVKGNHDWNDMAVWPEMMFGLSPDLSFMVCEKPMFIDAGEGWISAIPHIRRHAIKGSFEDTVAGAIPEQDGRPVLLCAHMALDGTTPLPASDKGGEPQMTEKALEAYGDALKGAFFGHIHKREEYDTVVPCRYIGTPIRITFAEERSETGGWIADFEGNARVINCPSRELITIKGKNKKEAVKALGLLSEEGVGQDGYEQPFIRILVESGEKISPAEIDSAAGSFFESVVVVDSKDREDGMQGGVLAMPEIHEGVGRGLLSVASMLKPYFEENLPCPDTAPAFVSIGMELLEGSSVEELWKTMKEAARREKEIQTGDDNPIEIVSESPLSALSILSEAEERPDAEPALPEGWIF